MSGMGPAAAGHVRDALLYLARAGEAEDWSAGCSDPHIASESYSAATWRFAAAGAEAGP